MKQGIPFSILLVEDDEDDRYFMDAAFQKVGYEAEVKKFITGSALLHYLEQIDASLLPSLIVLDDHLPGLDSIKLITLLKENTALQQIPIVVYSGVRSFYREKELISLGVYAYIEKGLSIDDSVHIAQQLKDYAERQKIKSK